MMLNGRLMRKHFGAADKATQHAVAKVEHRARGGEQSKGAENDHKEGRACVLPLNSFTIFIDTLS